MYIYIYTSKYVLRRIGARVQMHSRVAAQDTTSRTFESSRRTSGLPRAHRHQVQQTLRHVRVGPRGDCAEHHYVPQQIVWD